VNEFYKILGQCGSDRSEKIAKIHNLKLKVEFETCDKYDIAKDR
jgi:hypothetical protein